MKNSIHPQNNLYEDPSFPFGIFTINEKRCSPPGPKYNYLHWHEDLQFTIVTKGSVTMTVNGKNYRLETNDAIFINSGLLHMTNHISKNGEYVSFNFPTKMLSIIYGSKLESDYVLNFTMNYNLPAIPLTSDVQWQHEIINMLLSLYEFCKFSDVYGKEYEIALRLEYLWLIFIRNVKDYMHFSSKTFLRKQEYMQIMLSFIHENYTQEINLEDISKSAHISESQCCRLFKNILNTSPYEYLINYRINKSIDLLKETNMSITEIAIYVGFNDCSHFIQLFKKHTSKTPKNYRNNEKTF